MRILEGGAAIGGERIPQHRIDETIKQYEIQILSLLNVVKFGPIGSTGKKESNGDIDLALESPQSLAEINTILNTNGIRTVMNKGLGELNTEFHQYENGQMTEDLVQVDLMVGNYDWLSFMYMGYSETETKYKPLTRTSLVYALLRIIPEVVKEDGSVEFYSISPNRGFFKKSGIKNEKGFKSKRIEAENNNSPIDLSRLVGISVRDLTLPFEQLWAVCKNTHDTETVVKLGNYVEGFATNQKMTVPSEVMNLTPMTEATSVAHMVHLEDLVYEGKGEKMFTYLDDMFDTLKGNTTTAKTTVKIDGSPMIAMASSFPGVDGPFVGMKNTFAKVPQLFQTDEAIDEKYGHIPDLANKLKTGLYFADKLGLPAGEIWKGDFLFTKGDIQLKTSEGIEYVTFKPNTIVYAIEKGSTLGEKVLQSDIGIVFHTIHRGEDVKSSESNVSYDVDVSILEIPDNAVILDANLPSLAGTVFLTKEETSEVEKDIKYGKRLFNQIERRNPDILSPNSVQQGLLNKFENQAVRISMDDDQFFGDPSVYVEKFVEWFSKKFDDESLTKKTERGKTSTIDRKNALIEYFQSNEGFFNLISLQQIVVKLKKLFISKLENLGDLTPYEELPDGNIKLTNHEGFAVSDIDGNIIKFVDRLVFSKANLTGHTMTEDAKADLKNDAGEFISTLNLNPKKLTISPKSKRVIPEIDNVNATVQPIDKVTRDVAAKAVVGAVDPESLISQEIPTGGRRPIVVLNKGDYTLSLEFKPAPGVSTKIDAKQTKAMETWWMYFMHARLNHMDYPTIEEVVEDFTKVDLDWYEGFKTGAEAVAQFLDEDPEYIFSREDSQIPKGNYPAIHEMIDSLFTKRRDVFGTIGSKKDAWNPSDLYVIHKLFIDEFMATWGSFQEKPDLTLDEVNAFLSANLKAKQLIGISLKKLTNANEPALDLIDSAEQIDKAPHAFKLEAFGLSTILPSEPGRSSSGGMLKFSVDESPVLGAYRFFGESKFTTRFCGALQLELKKPKSKAQLGKLPSSITKLLLDRYQLSFPGKKEKTAFLVNKDPTMLSEVIQNASEVEAKLGALTTISGSATKEYFDRLFQYDLKEDSIEIKEDYVHAGFLIQTIYFGRIIAEAVSRDETDYLLKLLYEGAAKMGSDNAPYIKLS